MHTDDRRTVSGCFLFADHGLTEAAEAILDRCPIRSYRKGELIYSRDCFERAVGVLLSGAPVCPGKEGHAAAAPDRPVGRVGRM